MNTTGGTAEPASDLNCWSVVLPELTQFPFDVPSV
jgi:hypothetical protein